MAGIGDWMYSDTGTARNAAGEINPYLSRWTGGSWTGMVGPNGEAGSGGGSDYSTSTDSPSTSALPGPSQLPENFWRDLGYTGPTYDYGQGEYAFDAPTVNPALIQWAAENGYTPGYTEGYGGMLKNGQIVPGSAFGNRTNDDAGFIAGMLGIGAAGAAAGGLFGGAGTGAGAGNASAIANGALTGGVQGGGIGALGATEGALAGLGGVSGMDLAADGAASGGNAYGTTPTSGNGLLNTLTNGAKNVGQWALENPTQAIQIGGILGGLVGGKGGSGGTIAGPGGPGAQAGLTATPSAALNRQYVAPPSGYRPGFDPEHKYFTGIGAVGAGAAGVPGQMTTQDKTSPGSRG